MLQFSLIMMLFETNLKTIFLSGSSFALLGCVTVLVLWQSRYWYKQSHLRNIPGPPARSFALGALLFLFHVVSSADTLHYAGNLPQVFGLLEGWGFHVELAETYGRVAKSWGFFGVSYLLYSSAIDTYKRKFNRACSCTSAIQRRCIAS